MKNLDIILFWMCAFIVFALWYAYLMSNPSKDTLMKRFPFSDQKLTDQVHADYIYRDISYIVICLFVAAMSVNLRVHALWCSLFAFLYLVDYLLTYNNPLTTVYIGKIKIHCSYPYVIGALLGVIFAYNLFSLVAKLFSK
jgi:hypothetical protein